MAVVDVNNINKLNCALLETFNNQLYRMQMGYPFIINETVEFAMDLLESIEYCIDDTDYNAIIVETTNKLYLDL